MIYLIERYGIFSNKNSRQEASIAKIIKFRRKKSNDFEFSSASSKDSVDKSLRKRKCSAPSICKRSKN